MLNDHEREEIVDWIRARRSDDDGCFARGHQARLYLYRANRGTYVIKVPEGRGPGLLVRIWMNRNEHRAYQRLQGIEGVPTCHELLERRYLVLEYVDADSLETHKLADPEAFYARLMALIEALHAAGVAHGDLRRKSNILVTPGERPVIIDFGVSVSLKEDSSWLRRRIFEWLTQDDRHAWVKLKYRRRRLAPPHVLQPRSPRPIKWIHRAIKRARRLWPGLVGESLESTERTLEDPRKVPARRPGAVGAPSSAPRS